MRQAFSLPVKSLMSHFRVPEFDSQICLLIPALHQHRGQDRVMIVQVIGPMTPSWETGIHSSWLTLAILGVWKVNLKKEVLAFSASLRHLLILYFKKNICHKPSRMKGTISTSYFVCINWRNNYCILIIYVV